MRKFTTDILRLILFILYVIAILFLLVSLLQKKDGITMADSIVPVEVRGPITSPDTPAIKITRSKSNQQHIKTLTITGTLSHEISNGNSLIIWPRNLRVKLYVNGIEKISAGQRSDFPDFIEYAGNSYQTFYIGNVSTTDTVRIVAETVYDTCQVDVIQNFFDNMYIGTEGALFRSIISHKLIHPIIGIVLSLVGILTLVTAFLQEIGKCSSIHEIYYVGGFCILGGIAYLYDSSYEFIDLFFPHPIFNTLIDLCTIPFLLLFYLLFIADVLQSPKAKRIMKLIVGVFILTEFTPILGQFMGYQDLHARQDISFFYGGYMALFANCIILYEILVLKRKNAVKVLVGTIPLLLSLVPRMLTPLLDQDGERTYLRVGILITCIILLHNSTLYIKRTMQLVEQEHDMKLEMKNAQVAVMLSQIHPHFLYNALNTLQHICEKDGALAAEAIGHFSKYLRGNMDSLTNDHPIPFLHELEHVKHYLYIQQLRFGDRLRIQYDLQLTNFYIPTLTLQPIVENAIRHGITKQARGGCVTISTRQMNEEIWILVRDDGVGFDSLAIKHDNMSHVGIKNVEKRLKLQCNGSLKINSNIGIGTLVTIRLKGMKHNEGNNRR